MPLDLEELKKLHDKAFVANETTRERAADDLVFYWVTQWDDSILSESQLAYRGEFNILRKAGRQIMTDLTENPVQVDFEPKDETREDSADLLDGLYRSDDTNNCSIEAYEVGEQEAVVCGVGAWQLYTEYDSMQTSDNKQVIRRKPIHEANNNLLWDPNSKRLDKADAKYCSLLTCYSEDAYKELVNDLTGEKLDEVTIDSFKHPEHSYTFPWVLGEGKKIYVAAFYYREKVKATKLIFMDPFGTELEVWEKDLKEVEDDMISQGYQLTDTKVVEKWQVTQYIASGAEILDTSIIVGQHIPVIPVFGEHAFVEGEEHWEGVSRLAKDPQRLRNFILSYIAEISSRSPRPKPIFFPEQIQGHEDMYSESGIDNNYPYLLQNRKSVDGEDLPIGPASQMPEQQIPQTLIALTQMTKEAVEDVANPGVPQDIADPEVSGKAVLALQARLDKQSVVYQTHRKHAKRRDAEVYASMASEVYDVPRRVKVTKPDGTKESVQVLQTVIDEETGDIVTIRDLRNAEFDVYSKIGPDYTTQKEQTIDKLNNLLLTMDPADPVSKILRLKILLLTDGADFDDIRDYVRKQLIIMGVRKPETEEEKQFAKQLAEQPEKPDPAMVLAMAEMEKAKADQMAAQTAQHKLEVDAQNEGMKRHTEKFKALTDRFEAMVKADVADADIEVKEAEAANKELENAANVIEFRRPLADWSTEELYAELGA